MIFTNPDHLTRCHYDLIIIGAGTIGLTIAAEFTKSPLKICLIEAGNQISRSSGYGNGSEDWSAEHYRAISDGRRLGLGGTSTIWGGALIPYLVSQDFNLRKFGHDWPFDFEELHKYIPKLEKIFGLNHRPYFAGPSDDIFRGDLDALLWRQPKWPLFNRRNTWKLFGGRLAKADNIDILIQHAVVDYVLEGSSISGVIVKNDGQRFKIGGKKLVISNGALESTRHVLHIDKLSCRRLSNAYSGLGRYLSDHLSADIGYISNLTNNNHIKLASFRLEGFTLRNCRAELPSTLNGASLPRGFIHFPIDSLQPRPIFTPLRLLNQKLQNNPFVRWRDCLIPFRDLRYIPTFIANILRYRAIHVGKTGCKVQLVVEQEPNPKNRVTLESNCGDEIGPARIDWNVGRMDVVNFLESSVSVQNLLAAHAARASMEFVPVRHAPENLASMLMSQGGIYHPVGTLRSSKTRQNGAVDRTGKLYGFENVHVLSTAILPSSGASNPTMHMLLMGLCFAQFIKDGAK